MLAEIHSHNHNPDDYSFFTYALTLFGLFLSRTRLVFSTASIDQEYLFLCSLIIPFHTRSCLASITMASRSPLVDLPAELRIQILRYLLVKPSKEDDKYTTVDLIPAGQPPSDRITTNEIHTNILLACRQFLIDGREILYTENKFQVHGDEATITANHFLTTIGPANLARLRHLTLTNIREIEKDKRGPARYRSQFERFDRWIEELFEGFPQLQLDVLAVNIDSPQYTSRDSLTPLQPKQFIVEIGESEEYELNVITSLSPIITALGSVGWRLLNYLGVVRATTSMSTVCPALLPYIYWGRYQHGGYVIFSHRPLPMVGAAPDEHTLRRDLLFPLGFDSPRPSLVELMGIKLVQIFVASLSD